QPGSETNAPDLRHTMALVRTFLDRSRADLAGGPLGRRSLPVATRVSLDCVGCHVNRDRHQTLFGSDCQSCHNVDAWTIATFVHPSPSSQDCVQCHQAPPSHYMMHFQMMSQPMAMQPSARVEQCFLCHQTDAWNQIRNVARREMH
ncbi:MAG: hypothetical protein JWP20_1613, partial [Roseomonas sp.]|nr:hypothetical protein [Roseomonas sp.]